MPVIVICRMGLRAIVRARDRLSGCRRMDAHAQLGFEPTSIAGDQFGRDLSAELKMWAEVVEKAKIKLP